VSGRVKFKARHYVVPAKAGTHNPGVAALADGRFNGIFQTTGHGVWVPAFAGTT
jgi:hypothetical protein